ncbi:unnamed protein product, partial [marine sediment metagenome]
MNCRKSYKGAALIISMIFVLIFSALAVSMATLSGTNVQIAENQRKANCARACAQSGLEIIRLWSNQVSIPGDTPENQQFDLIADCFQSTVTGISNIAPEYDGSCLTIPTIAFDSTKGQNFSAQITQIGLQTLQVDVTGMYGELTKTISVNFVFGTRAHNVFDFGVATKGPLSLSGNIELEGVNISVESSVYIE